MKKAPCERDFSFGAYCVYSISIPFICKAAIFAVFSYCGYFVPNDASRIHGYHSIFFDYLFLFARMLCRIWGK